MFLESITPTRRTLDQLANAIVLTAQSRLQSNALIRERHVRELRKLEDQNQELLRMKMNQLITDEDFRSQRDILSQARTAIKASDTTTQNGNRTVLNQLELICQPLLRTETSKAGATVGAPRSIPRKRTK